MNITENLQYLSELVAVAGFEKAASEKVAELFKGCCDYVEVDKFSNVICLKKGTSDKAKKIIITAHIDEIGFLVRSIDEKGFVGIANIGGIDSKILLAQEVIIHGKKDVIGIIGATPPHLMKAEDSNKPVKINDLFVDTGFTGKELKEIVSVGDIVSFKSKFTIMNEQKVSGKSLDNRASVACLLMILENLKNIKHENDIIFVASTQEEASLVGVITASYSLMPDAAIVIDACHGDIPDLSKDYSSTPGKGPEISIGPNLHPKMVNKLFELGKEYSIPFQKMVEAGDTGTEAWATQVSTKGIPTALLSIPIRYMHTEVETLNIEDIKYTARLVAEFAKIGSTELEELISII
ncbi:M42 family peptidase [Ruminiclostridium herbifermentans]|uniref:M42 family peptidase n=1 Tax=Ruminiclostridium herbifermentans TaxID=2488810 RepID=A0A4U7JKM4_9FIRM|nr:M42 family metallopeptidase [Ruminiclostridium herbifermentans]QNU68577.1 M42 family peptidase [Ruminiclostridium herbifermentans]